MTKPPMRMQFDPQGALAYLDALEEGIKTEVLRPAAEAAARVYRDEAIVRAPRTTKGHWFYGTSAKGAPRGEKKQHAYWIEPGTLAASIYEAYSPERSEEGKSHTYHVSWNKKKAPHGFMVEFGTATAAPHSFLRSAYLAVGDQAMASAQKAVVERGQKVIDGLRG